MKIKFHNLFIFLFLMVINFYEIICMEKNVENFSQETADKQLWDIIDNITIHEQKGGTFNCDNGGIAYNGERVHWEYHPGEVVFTKSRGLRNTSCFNVKPIEKMITTHYINKKLLQNPKYFYVHCKLKLNLQEDWSPDYNPVKVKWNGSIKKSITSLKNLVLLNLSSEKIKSLLDQTQKDKNEPIKKELASYLLYNLKAPTIMPKKKLIQYLPVDEIPTHECLVKSLDECFKNYLKENFLFAETNENQFEESKLKEIEENLEKTKSSIEAYLDRGGSIMLPLTYCILNNYIFFSDSLHPSKKFKKLSKWLLKDKEGWYYLDELLIQIALKGKKDHLQTQFLHCLTIIRKYQTLETAQKRINDNDIFYRIAKAGKTSWVKLFLNEKLITEKVLNDTFLKVALLKEENHREIRKEHIKIFQILKNAGANNLNEALIAVAKKGNPYVVHKDDIIEKNFSIIKLLEWGADPNVLFYYDNKNQRRCYWQQAWYDGTKLLTQILLHPKRIRIEGEPSDFEYLTDKEDQKVLSIESMFDNGKEEGQQDLYNYGIKVYELAFEAHKTKSPEDLQKLREHVINQNTKYMISVGEQALKKLEEQGTVSLKENSTNDSNSLVEHPVQIAGQNKTTNNHFLQKLYGLFRRPTSLLQNLFTLPRILLGKLYSLKSGLGF